MTKSGGNTEKYLLNNTTVITLLKHYFFIKILVTKEKKKKQCEFDFNQHKVYQIMWKLATPTLPESLILSKWWIYVSKIWRLQTLVMPTIFAQNLSKFKITFFSSHNRHHRNKLFYNHYGHIFWQFNDSQNYRKIFVLVKEIFCSALQFTTKQT